MSHSVTTRWAGVVGYEAVCTCGWKSSADLVKARIEYEAIAHRRTTRDFDPEPGAPELVDTIVIADPDADHLPHGCIEASALISLATELIKLHRIHAKLHGTLVDAPCLRRIEASDGRIVAHVSVGPAVGGDWIKLVLQPDLSWKEEEK